MSQSGVKDLTEGAIFKPLIRLAMPIMATGFIQVSHTLINMAWVGRLGSEHVAAVGGVGILLWLTSSLALMTKVGAEISIAQCIGAKTLDKAGKYASHTITIAVIMGLVIGIILNGASETIISFYKLEEYIANMANDYLKIISFAMPMMFFSNTFTGIYNGTGRTSIPFYIIVFGLACNILLDPLFIFTLNLGVEGAGYATVLSQAIVAGLFIWQSKQKNGVLQNFPYFVKLQKSYTLHLFRLGAPIAVMNCFFAIIGFYIARIASVYGGHLGVMCQSTGGQIEGITWTTSQGFATALGTFVAQNHAAGKIERTWKAYRYTLSVLLALGVVVTAAFLLFGKEIFGVFVPEHQARIAGGEYLFIAAFSQIFMMIEITTFGMWNGFGRTIPPAVISIILNVARIPFALWMAQLYGVNGVWIAITISAIIKGIVSPAWFQLSLKPSGKLKVEN